jgi:transcriptional regulator with XRE-family HTH domain
VERKRKMNFFSEIVARLKYELHVSKDMEVADALGLSKSAFSERKRRGEFPEKKLWALAESRPELNLDVGYVLNGIKRSHATPEKSLLEIIDRFLLVYNVNSEQADEALSLPPGTIDKALSLELAAAPDHLSAGGGKTKYPTAHPRAATMASDTDAKKHLPPREAALLDNYNHLSEEDKRALERTALGLAKQMMDRAA